MARRHRPAPASERFGGTFELNGYAALARRQIFDAAPPEQQARMRAAEKARGIYRAWNAVCAGTREGEHVTGLRYLSDENELLVYTDGAAWTQEFTMLREIIRARMGHEGADIARIRFRTSKAGFTKKFASGAGRLPADAAVPKKPTVERHELTPAQDAEISEYVSGISDERLRKALKSAWKASAECSVTKKDEI